MTCHGLPCIYRARVEMPGNVPREVEVGTRLDRGQRITDVCGDRSMWWSQPGASADPQGSSNPRSQSLASPGRDGKMKPVADDIRRISPFGSPKREGSTTKRGETPEEKRRQVDPPQGGSGARVHRHRLWQNRCPLRLPEYMDGPASPASPREVRLNGFPRALAEVRRHRIGDDGRRVPEAAPTGFSDARFVVQPAYSLGPHSVSPLRRLAGGCAPSDPRNGNGAP